MEGCLLSTGAFTASLPTRLLDSSRPGTRSLLGPSKVLRCLPASVLYHQGDGTVRVGGSLGCESAELGSECISN